MLPLMVASAGLDAVGGDVVEQHVEAGERADMGDAVAHLAGADHADFANVSAMFSAGSLRAFGRSLTSIMIALRLSTTIRARHHTHAAPFDHGQRPSLPSSAASSGSAW